MGTALGLGEPWGPRMESRALGTAQGMCHRVVARPSSLGDIFPPACPRCASERWVGCEEEEGGSCRARDGGGIIKALLEVGYICKLHKCCGAGQLGGCRCNRLAGGLGGHWRWPNGHRGK